VTVTVEGNGQVEGRSTHEPMSLFKGEFEKMGTEMQC